jgi:hypothetical protein
VLGHVLLFLAEHLSFIERVSSFLSRHGVSVSIVHVSHHNKPDSRGSLTSNHGAPGKEDFVKAVSSKVIFLDNRVLVLDEVMVPHFDGVSVMCTLVTNSLDFKATTFNLVNIPVERAGSISAGEDVLTHEDSPK